MPKLCLLKKKSAQLLLLDHELNIFSEFFELQLVNVCQKANSEFQQIFFNLRRSFEKSFGRNKGR